MGIPRKSHHRAFHSLTVALLALPVLWTGCADQTTTPEGTEATSTTATPDNRTTLGGGYDEPVLSFGEQLIGQIQEAYETRNLTLYEQLFDQDQFVFVFDPQDVAENPDIPEAWGWASEWIAHRNMFDDESIVDVSLGWDSVVEIPVTQWNRPRGLPVGTREVAVSGVHIIVEVVDPSGGPNIVLEIDGDRAHFFIAREPGGSALGTDTTWKVVRWQDERVAAAVAVEQMSWGVLKSLFR